MHDPDTLAFQIKWPWWGRKIGKKTYYPDAVLVWHHDPSNYDTYVCGWWYQPLTGQQRAKVDELIDDEDDNIRSFFPDCGDDFDEMKRRTSRIFQIAYAFERPWWKHPKWHFWHWRLTVVPLRNFKRWAFTRCARCGKRFGWSEAPVCHQWYSDGPRWFRGEEGKYHSACLRI